MIISFIKSMWKWALSGFKVSDGELAANSERICKACEHYLEVRDKCLECGCFMALKRKIKNTNCPVGKW